MARKKLSIKPEQKKHPLKKKLQAKNDLLFPSMSKRLYRSDTLLTDNKTFIIILPDAHEWLEQMGIQPELINSFDWEDIDLQLDFNRKEPLNIDDKGKIESMGSIHNEFYGIIKTMHSNCIFHQITKWFGKVVNTLVIILAEEYGKPVAIVKTQE